MYPEKYCLLQVFIINFVLDMNKLAEYICSCTLSEQNGVKETGCAPTAAIITTHLVHFVTGTMSWPLLFKFVA